MERFWKAVNKLRSEDKEKHEVNEVFWYDVEEDTAFVHWATVDDLSVFEKASKFQHGMAELARRMQIDPALRDVKYIVGISRIVKDNPRLIRRLGFQVFDSEKDEDNIREISKLGLTLRSNETPSDEAYAVALRRDFLARWNPRTQNDP